MKKTFASGMFLAFCVLFSACSITQEMQDGANFTGLKKVYIDNSAGGENFFSSFTDAAQVNEELKSAVSACLAAKGFEPVANKSEAEIIFRPLWSVSIRTSNDAANPLPISFVNTLGIGESGMSEYATLEIQAILPDDVNIWAWRGFSPLEVSKTSFNIGTLRPQVDWCLQYFPPEKYPSALQEIKKEKEQARVEAEENPFKEVHIKAREQSESSAANTN